MNIITSKETTLSDYLSPTINATWIPKHHHEEILTTLESFSSNKVTQAEFDALCKTYITAETKITMESPATTAIVGLSNTDEHWSTGFIASDYIELDEQYKWIVSKSEGKLTAIYWSGLVLIDGDEVIRIAVYSPDPIQEYSLFIEPSLLEKIKSITDKRLVNHVNDTLQQLFMLVAKELLKARELKEL